MSEFIKSLGYLGFGTTDLKGWEGFGADTLGLVASWVGDDRLDLRMDERQARITLRAADEEALDFIGWETVGPRQLEALFTHLEAAGCEPSWEPAALADDRGVQGLFSCQDPTGERLEFFWGQRRVAAPFQPTTAIRGFVTDALGLGHIVLQRSQPDVLIDFYTDVLGFRLTDQFEDKLVFLGCNPRHHSFAVGNLGGPDRVLHIMVEVEELSDLGITFDACVDQALRMSTMGMHANDRMISFYVQTPSGFEVEYGWSGLEVDDDSWTATRIDRPSYWGHRMLDYDDGSIGKPRFQRVAD